MSEPTRLPVFLWAWRSGSEVRALIAVAMLALAGSELELLRARIMSGLAEARRKGKKLGRPAGSVLTPAKLLLKHRDVARLLQSGQSIRNAAKLSEKSVSTVQRVKALLDAS